MVILPLQVKCIKEQDMTSVEFPELAVEDIGQLVDVSLFLQQRHIL